MKLFASLTSPYARKVRIVLIEKLLPFELVIDSPWEQNTRIVAHNPLGKIPVLVVGNGEVIYDSPVICSYLEVIAPSPALVPADPLAAVRVRRTEALCDGIIDAAFAIVLEARRPETLRHPPEVARQEEKIVRSLDVLEAATTADLWLHGEHFSLADAAAAAALGYLDFRLAHLDWRRRCPRLAELSARLGQRDSVVRTRPPA